MRTGIRRRLLIALGLTGALAACSGSGGPGDSGGLVDHLFGRGHVSGDGASVTITGMDSRLDALPLAVAHCGHFHKSAQFAATSAGAYTFRCVAR